MYDVEPFGFEWNMLEMRGKTYLGHCDFENGSSFQILINLFSNGKVGVSIDRVSFFLFRDTSSIVDDEGGAYCAEKLLLPISDGKQFVKFFREFIKRLPNYA